MPPTTLTDPWLRTREGRVGKDTEERYAVNVRVVEVKEGCGTVIGRVPHSRDEQGSLDISWR